jgi:hypothetical protein
MPTLQILATRTARTNGGHGALAGGDCFTVRYNGARSDHDACPCHLRTPTNVKVFTNDRDQRIKSSKNRKEIRADKRGAAWCNKDVSFKVLLSVVDFAHFNALLYRSKAIRYLARVQQNQWIVVLHKLGRDNASVRAVRGFDQLAYRSRIESNIVMAKEKKGRAFDGQSALVAGPAEASVIVQHLDECAWRYGRDSVRNVVKIAVGDDQDA